jgi:pimeloyl-ACP methyl ester carboxylesterase
MPEITPALYRAGSGEPLVLLHGFTGAWMHWRPLLAGLSERYEVIAPTLHGHDGGGPYPQDAPISFAGSTDWLEGHLDELGVRTAHFVGNSMGGALALELAKRGRARSVVALAPAGGWTPGDGEAARLAKFFARQLRTTRALHSRMSLILARPRVRRMALRDIMRHGERVPASDALALVEASLRCTIAERAIAALRADEGLTLTDLDRIACPVLLATPQFDRVLPPALHAPRLRREIPGVDSIVLADCGHVPMWEDAEHLVRTIGEFVDRHTPAGESAAPGAPAAPEAAAPAPAPS